MTQASTGSHGGERKDATELLREVRAALSAIYHDVNNPLAIISGNAQYLIEMGRATGFDDDLMQPIRDIDEACERVAARLRDLVRLRDEVADYVASEGDGTPGMHPGK